MSNAILDPTGRGAGGSASDRGALAERHGALTGLRVGLLDNTKHNAMLFLQEVGELLVTQHGAASVSIVETKANFSVPVDESIVSRFEQECDVVITGVGDCGSCSAAAVADGINFERAGIPAAVVLTDAFGVTGRMMAEVHGAPGYEWITTEHPMASLSPDEVRERAAGLMPQVVDALSRVRS
ncbi:UGSC family (seleno)protein [Agromyces bauzanensis]